MIKPEIEFTPMTPGVRREERRATGHSPLAGKVEPHLVASERASRLHHGLPGLVSQVKQIVIGRPIPSSYLDHQRLTKFRALAVLSSDAISSTAYATEEILLVLMAAGSAAVTLAVPVTLAIVLLLAIVTFSYRQILRLYPQGGGTYVVTKDNLGQTAAVSAGSALLIDYVLTVAVSVAAGVAAVTSAFPGLTPHAVPLALLAIAFLTIANLRGLRESAALFTLPAYAFIASLLILFAIGAWRWHFGMPPVEAVAGGVPHVTESLGALLVLRAFASGCSAMTGTEAISDGVAVFHEPQARNAATTLLWMALCLGTLFIGTSVFAFHFGLLPREGETIVSQIARATVGRGPFYYVIQATTAMILVLAANTSFADFPRLASFMAKDRLLPRQFVFRGDRLALSSGVIALGSLAGLLIVLVNGNVHHLVPMYAVGVFLAFTFSQASMVRRWWTRRESGWRQGLVINALGTVTTAVVALVIAATKFAHGAWMVILLLPVLVITLHAIQRHYLRVTEQMTPTGQERSQGQDTAVCRTFVLVASLSRSSLRNLRFARSLSGDVTALHVTDDLPAAMRLQQEWNSLALGVPLVVLESPFRSLVSPILAFLDSQATSAGPTVTTVVLSELVLKHWWQFALHNQDALKLKLALFFRPHTVVIDIPFHLEG